MNKTVKQIIDTDYKDYSLYTVYERAIPSVIDGFKPVQRFVLYNALNRPNPYTTKYKVADCPVSSLGYHHGETSAIDASIKMTAEYRNNIPVFSGYGSFGSRLVPESAAPRYIFSTVNPVLKKIFVDTDVAPKHEDEEHIPPTHYLPVIPWVLINGSKGAAVGFATLTLPRALPDILNAVKAYLRKPEGYSCADITPTFPQFFGTVEKDTENNRWVVQGILKEERNYFVIEELPYGEDRESYVSFLNDLEEKGKIDSYEENCSDRFGFRIKVTKSQREAIKDPMKTFGLVKYFTENFTMIDAEGKLRIFENVGEIISYFCEYRLKMFGVKIEKEKQELSRKISVAEAKTKFIQAVRGGDVNIREWGRKQVLEYIRGKITEEKFGEEFVNIPFHRFTADAVEELQKDVDDMMWELGNLQKTTPVSRYKEVLKTI